MVVCSSHHPSAQCLTPLGPESSRHTLQVICLECDTGIITTPVRSPSSTNAVGCIRKDVQLACCFRLCIAGLEFCIARVGLCFAGFRLCVAGFGSAVQGYGFVMQGLGFALQESDPVQQYLGIFFAQYDGCIITAPHLPFNRNDQYFFNNKGLSSMAQIACRSMSIIVLSSLHCVCPSTNPACICQQGRSLPRDPAVCCRI